MSINELKGLALSAVRRSSNRVLWTYEGSGFGNALYYMMKAHAEQRAGAGTRALWTHKMEYWEKHFPEGFRDLTIRRDQVSFFSPRPNASWYQSFGVDFSEGDLRSFVNEYILRPGGRFSREVERCSDEDTVWINVRRGDYYSVPKFRGIYSFDISEYLRVAVARAEAKESIRRIGLVSDDLDWCRLKLSWLTNVAPVRFAPDDASPVEQLAQLAGARRLILGNSTFSYWAAYISNQRRLSMGETEARSWVIAPAFHNRFSPEVATQLDPEWDIMTSIPGGWDG